MPRLAKVIVLEWLGYFEAVASVQHFDKVQFVKVLHGAALSGACDQDPRFPSEWVPVHRLREIELIHPSVRRLRKLRVRAAVENWPAMQIEGAEAARKCLGAIHGDLLGDW